MRLDELCRDATRPDSRRDFGGDIIPSIIHTNRVFAYQFLDDIDEPSESGKAWRKIMKVVVPVWYFFAIGPACIWGNTAFSVGGFPTLWSWQIVWWILGIVMMWALCFKAEMATTNETQIQRAEVETMTVVKEA